MDASEGDERWVVRRRGPRAAVLEELERLAQELPSPAEALRRVAVARKLTARFGLQRVDLIVDFRRTESGHVEHTRRRGSSQESWTRLPWLHVRSGEAEVVVSRTLHQKEVRMFRQGVETQRTRYSLDEVRVRVGERGLRRAVGRAASWGQVTPAALELGVPGLDAELPPTAPGSRLEQQAAWGTGLVASALLLVALPWLLAPSPVPPPVYETEAIKLALADDPDAATVRRGLGHEVAERRREALVASAALPRFERWRVTRRAASDASPQVRDVALSLLSEQGSLGAATLASLQGRGPKALRLAAFQRLAATGDQRALVLAKRGLAGGAASGPVSLELQRAWVHALAEGAAPGDHSAVAILRRVLVGADSGLAAQAAWALAKIDPKASKTLAKAFEGAWRARAADPNVFGRSAFLTLARALASVERSHAYLRGAAGDPRLSARDRRALQRLLR